MNVLQVVEASNAGVGRHLIGLCEGLMDQGHRVTVAYAPGRIDEAFRRFVTGGRSGVHFVPLEVERAVSPVSDLRGVVRLLRLLRSRGPFDVVHGHSSKGGALARIAGRCSGLPTVYTPNSLVLASPEISRAGAVLYTAIERTLGRRATSRIIAVSGEERELILKLGLVPEDRVVVIENGIDDEEFEYFSGEAEGEDADRRPSTFGSIMRFSPQKAPGHLVEAFVRLVETPPRNPVRLVIAGDGELFGEVERQVAASGMGDRISLLGWREDTRDMLRKLDVFVLPSLYEGFSYAVLEAMAARLPIVSTNVSGARDTVARVPGNVVVPVGNVEALARGMERIMTPDGHEPLRRFLRRVGQANHDYARARFTQSETTRRTLDLYRTLTR